MIKNRIMYMYHEREFRIITRTMRWSRPLPPKSKAILLSRLHKAYAEWGMGNAIRVLSNLGFTVTLEVIMETVNLSNSKNIDTHDMLGSEFHVVVSENERRREKRKKWNPHLNCHQRAWVFYGAHSTETGNIFINIC